METLSPAAERFILHWGEMGTRWGVNRTVAQIHALLYVSPKPLNAEEVSQALSMGRSNVSAGLRELQRWGIVKATHQLGDRRDYFESPQDTWQMTRLILDERKRREIDPTLQVLEACLAECEADSDAEPRVRERLQNMLALFQTVHAWYGEIMNLSDAELKRLVGLSRQVRKLLRFRA